MTTPNECFPDPETMSDEEKIDLITALHEANHHYIDSLRDMADVLASTASSNVVIAEQMLADNTKGERRQALITAAVKLDFIGRTSLAYLGVTPEDIVEAGKFADIVSTLEDDPQFNPEVEEE